MDIVNIENNIKKHITLAKTELRTFMRREIRRLIIKLESRMKLDSILEISENK